MSDDKKKGPGALSLGTAAVGATFGILQARSQNKAVRKMSKETQRRLNMMITAIRVDRLRQTDRLGREAQTAVKGVMNVAPRSLAVIETLASRVAANVASDQFAIDEQASRQIASVEAEKQNVANEAASQWTNPMAAGITGGLQGFQSGMQLEAAIRKRDAAAGQSDMAIQTMGQFTQSLIAQRDFMVKQAQHGLNRLGDFAASLSRRGF